jgi:hypothetical protein
VKKRAAGVAAERGNGHRIIRSMKRDNVTIPRRTLRGDTWAEGSFPGLHPQGHKIAMADLGRSTWYGTERVLGH